MSAAAGKRTPDPTGDVLFARAYLPRVAEPSAPALARLVAEAGLLEAAERVSGGHVDELVSAETRARRGRGGHRASRRGRRRGWSSTPRLGVLHTRPLPA